MSIIGAWVRRAGATAILAEVLGYYPATIDKHAVASASTYAQYVSNWASEGTP
jgi:hypothetical protein